MDAITVTGIFIGLIAAVFIWFLKELIGHVGRYKESLSNFKSNFQELLESKEVNLASLSNKNQKLATTHCLLVQKNGREFLKFTGKKLNLNKSLEYIVPMITDHGLKSIPAILTTLGILGTFIGISLGLYSFGNAVDSSQLIAQSNSLMLGMKTAFWTSAAGMSLSGIVMAILTYYQKKWQKDYSKQVNEIKGQTREVSATDLLSRVAFNLENKESEHQNFSELIAVLKKQAEKPVLDADKFKSILEDSLSAPLQAKLAEIENISNKNFQKNDQLAADIGSAVSSSLSSLLQDNVTAPIKHEIQQLHQDGVARGVEILLDIKDKLDESNDVTLSGIQSIVETNIAMPITSLVAEVQKNKGLTASDLETIIVNNVTRSLSESNSNTNNILTELATLENELRKIEPITAHDVGVIVTENITLPIGYKLDSIGTGISELAKDRSSEFERLVISMKTQIVEPITQELSETNRVVEKFAEVSNELNQSVSKTVEKMAEATQSINNFEEKTLLKLNEFAGSLDKSLTEFAENSTASLTSITQKIGDVVELGSESIKEQTNAFTVLIDESKGMFNAQSQALESIGITSAKLLTTAKTELEQGLGDIDTKVINMSAVVQDELEQFRINYQDNLKLFFDTQSIALEESLGKQNKGLTDAVDKFKGVFEEEYSKRHGFLNSLNEQYENLMKSAKTIEHLAETIGLSKVGRFGELEHLTDSIGRQVSQMNKSFEKASKNFETVALKMQPQMDDYFKRANEGVEKYFSSFDNVSSRIHSQLFEAAEFLIVARKEQLETEKLSDNGNVKDNR